MGRGEKELDNKIDPHRSSTIKGSGKGEWDFSIGTIGEVCTRGSAIISTTALRRIWSQWSRFCVAFARPIPRKGFSLSVRIFSSVAKKSLPI